MSRAVIVVTKVSEKIDSFSWIIIVVVMSTYNLHVDVPFVQQIAKLREEEASDSSWFVLPEEGDEDVNWLSFSVEIEAPEYYSVNPLKNAEGDRLSPYRNGLFRVHLKISENYPAEAPEATFQTKIWHPQIAPDSGKPCVDYLKEQWKSTMGIRDVLVMLRQLLASPSQGK